MNANDLIPKGSYGGGCMGCGRWILVFLFVFMLTVTILRLLFGS